MSETINDEMRRIGILIRDQDNRHTDQPMFIVQENRPQVTDPDYHDTHIEWRETKSGENVLASNAYAKKLEAKFKLTYEVPKNWNRYHVADSWEFVTACFTEQGCKDYIKSNGHNHKELRIYVEGSFRNHEYQMIRNFLKSLAPVDE